jgi:outer membrane protein assembly factor BamB
VLSGWTQAGGGAGRSRCTPDPGPVRAPGVLWSALTEPKMATEPVLARSGDRRLALVGGVRSIWAIDMADGTEAWTAQLMGPIASSPTVLGASIWAGSLDGFGSTLSTDTGAEIGVYEGDFVFEGPALTIDGLVVFEETARSGAVPTSRLHAIDGKSLEKRWHVDFPGGDGCAPASDGERVFVHVSDGLNAVNVADGSLAWKYERPRRRQPSGPVVAGGRVVIQSVSRLPGGHLTALDAKTSAVLWDEDLRLRALGDLALSEDGLFAVMSSGRLQRRDPATGALTWEVDLPGRSETGPVVAAEHVFVVGEGFAAAFLRETGELVWTVNLDGEATHASVVGDALLIASPDGFLHCLVAGS